MIELGAFMGKVGVTKKNVLKLDVVKWSLNPSQQLLCRTPKIPAQWSSLRLPTMMRDLVDQDLGDLRLSTAWEASSLNMLYCL